MKTSRTTSFRLQRLTKTNSLRKESTQYHPNQTFKLAAINSVNRGVKYNQISYLTGDDLKKLRKQPILPDDTLHLAAHQNFTTIRKKYDDVRKQTYQKDQSIRRLKQEIQKYQTLQNQYSGKKNQGSGQVKQLNDKLDNMKLQLQQSTMNKKVLDSMRLRHKADKIFFDQRKYDLEKELTYLKKQLAIFHREGTAVEESADRTMKIYQKFKNQLDEENIQRQGHLMNLQQMINQKMECVQSNQVRELEIKQIAERAMQDKNQDQKQWRKIYLTHSFVGKMLRNKIDKQMDKFKVVEIAFKQIKTATGVNDAKTLVFKYLNKEQVYGELLGKIAENQKKIQNLKAQTEILIKEQKQLELEKQTIDSMKIKTVQLHDQLKDLEIYDQKKKAIQAFKAKMRSWIVKQLRKMKILSKKDIDLKIEPSDKGLMEGFKRYFQMISEQLQLAEKENIDQNERVEDLNNRDIEKVIRVKPKRARKNSMGQQIFDVDQQETTPSSNVEEIQVVDTQRQQLIKQNEKFMIQLKKKKEQERKILAQKAAQRQKKQKASAAAAAAKKVQPKPQE